MDNDVDKVHGAVVNYLGRLSQENLSDRQSEQLPDYLAAANYIENIGDMIETNFFDAGRQRLREGLEISEQTEYLLEAFHHKVSWCVERAARALVENDPATAAEVMQAKSEINQLEAAGLHVIWRGRKDDTVRFGRKTLEPEGE